MTGLLAGMLGMAINDGEVKLVASVGDRVTLGEKTTELIVIEQLNR